MHGIRRFIDRVGFSWQVCELSSVVHADPQPDTASSGGRASGGLYFLSRGTTLVLRDYPPAWADLTWRELEALRERAALLGSDTPTRLAATR